MKCEVARDLLPLYIDKLTSEESNKEIEKHLKNCKECYQYYQEMMGEIGVLAEIPKEEAEEVKRFLFKPDNNYRITYVAAGVSSRENVDDAIELGFSGEELEIRKNELIFYVHGQKLMELAHNIYQRCCK